VVTYTFASNLELMMIERTLLPTLTRDNPIFDIFPDKNLESFLLSWEQYDNYTGMMSPRGLDGRPSSVNPVGTKRYAMEPGVYGEFMTISEREILTSRQPGTLADVVDVTGLQTQRANQLLHRQIVRQTYLGWQLLVNGYFLATDPYGVLMHAASYTQRIYTAAVGWGTVATATPLKDFRAVRLLARGYSINLGRGSKAYANATTVSNLLNNTNASDLGGKRVEAGNTVNDLDSINRIFLANDCPQIVEQDKFWVDDTGTVQLDIPDNTVIVRGLRLDLAPLGNWCNCRNIENPGYAPGPYLRTFTNPYVVPGTPEVHRGVNGGLSLYYPSAIIKMNV
jgi:hypothetical protein